MRVALHGYGKMGKAVERIAGERGHEVVAVYDRGRRPQLSGADVLIDFSQPAALDGALDIACNAGIDLVIGTTGWNDRLDEARARVGEAKIGCVYASNFSPGANVLFALSRRAGKFFGRFPEYAAGIEERHHAQKKDAPSGTALRIAAEVKTGRGGKLEILYNSSGKFQRVVTAITARDDMTAIVGHRKSKDAAE